MELDNLHYSFRAIDGHDKPYNFVISAREPGKSTMFMLTKHYFAWKKDFAPLLYLVRNIVEITEGLITTIQDVIINKFTVVICSLPVKQIINLLSNENINIPILFDPN